MKSTIVILGLVFISCLFACDSDANIGNTSNFTRKLSNDTITVFLLNESSGKYYLDIIQSKNPRYLNLELRQNEDVLSSIGYSNVSPVIKEELPKIDTLDFNTDGLSEYVVYSYVEGSTYGADVDFIVYHGISTMELIRIPFERIKISYMDKFQDYIITSYEANGTEILYKFDKGNFIRQ